MYLRNLIHNWSGATINHGFHLFCSSLFYIKLAKPLAKKKKKSAKGGNRRVIIPGSNACEDDTYSISSPPVDQNDTFFAYSLELISFNIALC